MAGTKYPDPINQDMAHAYTNHTQIKWNGILGEISLIASNIKAPKNLQIYPNIDEDKIKITFNQSGSMDKVIRCIMSSVNGEVVFDSEITNLKRANDMISFEIKRPDNLEFWDEFNPKYKLWKCKSSIWL